MRVAPTSFHRPVLESKMLGAWVVALALVSTTGCTRTFAAAPRPDLSGAWDVIYDDYLDAEVRMGERVQRMRLSQDGGYLVASDAHGSTVLKIDCRREELICPHEVWPGELTLTNRTGDLDDEGEHLSVSLAGEGHGPCVLGSDSGLGADVVSLGSARDRNWEATALSHGKVTTVVSGRCLGAAGEGARVQIALSAGVTAVRR